MAQFALRMDYDRDADRGTLSHWVSANADRYLVVFETADGENPHIHAIIHSTKTIATLRASFKRAFPTKTGNASYSLKKCDKEFRDYELYMCKGVDRDTPPVVEMRQGLEYTDEAIAEAHGKYWVNNAAIQQAREERKNALKLDIVEAVEKVCKEKGVRSHDRKGIALVYIRMKVRSKRGINLFQARAVVNTVSCLLDDTGDTEEDLASHIAQL